MNKFRSLIISIAAFAALCVPALAPASTNLAGLEAARFDTIIGGQQVQLWRLAGASGIEVCVTNYGARIVSLMAPDRAGVMRDVTLGPDNIAQLSDPEGGYRYFGATVGRYAGRIAGGELTIGGKRHKLLTGEGPNTLHGGPQGFSAQVFEPVAESDTSLTLVYTSAAGEMGFPGTLILSVTFTVTASKTLTVSYQATTTATTVVNVTNHTLWNLDGDGSQPATSHQLWLGADSYLPLGEGGIPTGEIASTTGTPFDFKSRLEPISRHLDADFEPVAQAGGGIDSYFIFSDDGSGDAHRAVLYSPASGILMDVSTTEPGVQVTTAAGLGSLAPGKRGVRYARQGGVCLDTQHYPDAPSHAAWPSTLLRPGELFESQTTYKFRALGFEY